MTPDESLLVAKFKVEVAHRAFDVDPEGDEDWHSLTVGWAIGKGLLPADARAFADYIRYETNLG